MNAKYGLVVGSGIGAKVRELPGSLFRIHTRFGTIGGWMVDSDDGEVPVVFRHGIDGKLQPHEVMYDAIASGLSQLKITHCVSTAAVGTLVPGWQIGGVVICTDFIDFTHRPPSQIKSADRHVSMSNPFDAEISRHLLSEAALHFGAVYHPAVYLGVNGPRYETNAEIDMFRRFGASVVGMTVTTEAISMRHADIRYSCIACITNPTGADAESEPNHDEVSNVMEAESSSLILTSLRSLQAATRR